MGIATSCPPQRAPVPGPGATSSATVSQPSGGDRHLEQFLIRPRKACLCPCSVFFTARIWWEHLKEIPLDSYVCLAFLRVG